MATNDKRPRATYVSVAYTHALTDPRVRRHCEAMARAGWRVVQLGLARPGEASVSRANGVVYVRSTDTRYRGDSIWRYALAYGRFLIWSRSMLMRLRRSAAPQLIQVNNLPNFLVWATIGLRGHGARVILDMHDPQPELFKSKFGARLGSCAVGHLMELEERLAAAAADAVLCVHEEHARLTVAHGVPKTKIGVVENRADGFVFPNFTPRLPSRALVYHGTIATRLGLDIVLAGLKETVQQYPDLTFTVLGDGDAVDDLQQLSGALGLAKHVSIPGERFDIHEVVALLAGKGIGVVPIRRDVFTDVMLPTKLIEYARLGLPAIVAWTPTIGSYFPKDSVYYVDPFTPEEFAEVLDEVFSNPDEACARAARAQRLDIAAPWQDHEATFVGLLEGVQKSE